MTPISWCDLWEIATVEEGNPALIIPDPENLRRVTLRYPDGSVAGVEWKDGCWRFSEAGHAQKRDDDAR